MSIENTLFLQQQHVSVMISATPASIKMDSLEVSGSSSYIDQKSAVGDTHVLPCSALCIYIYIHYIYTIYIHYISLRNMTAFCKNVV